MAYQLKNKEDFENYIKHIKILPSSNEIAIGEFNSSSLFDLYGLLTLIKDDRQISTTKQAQLLQKLDNNFPEGLSSLLHFPVSQTILQIFEEYIKDTFLSYVQRESKDLSDEETQELEKLKIIIAKKYPNLFLQLIKEEKNNTEFKLEQNYIRQTFSNIIDEYSQHTSEMQNNEDIQSAYYITSKNKFKKIRSATSGRKKSMKSVTDNLEKEFRKSLEQVIPSDFEKGISYTDLENQFNLSKVSDDYYGFLVYIKGIDDTFHITEDISTTEDGQLFLKYRKQESQNISYLHSLRDFLDDPSSFIAFSQEDYLKMRIELLDKLQYLTFQACSEEYNGPLFHPQDKNDPRNFFFQTS